MKAPFKLKIPVGWVRTCYTIGASLFWAVPNHGLHAQEFTYTNINGTITITRYNGPGGDVTIPSAIDGLPVGALGDWAIGYVTDWTVTSVTIPNSVVKLGAYAVSGCEALTNVTIGASVARIGDSAF